MIRTSTICASLLWLLFGITQAEESRPVESPDAMAMSAEEAKRKYEESLAAMPPELQKVFRDLEKKRLETPVRPRLTKLDEASLRAIPPDDLNASLVDYVYDRLDGKLGDPVPLSALPRGLQVFFLTYIVEAEVMNGGFNQFFWNSSSQYAMQIPAALRQLNAADAATIFEEAAVVAGSEDSMRAEQKAKRTLEAFSQSYRETNLTRFDAPFCKLAERFPALRAEFVRRHAELFTS